MKYAFEVYVHMHKTVEIEAGSDEEAFDKMSGMIDEVDVEEMEECWDNREYEFIGEVEE